MIESLFSTDIYITKFNNLEKLKTLCDSNFLSSMPWGQNYGAVQNNVVSTVNAWKTVPNYTMPHLMDEFSEITKFIEHHAKIYWDALDYVSFTSPKIAQSWLNVSDTTGAVGVHSHISYPIVAVLYLQAVPSEGDLVLINPMDTVLGFTPVPDRNGKQFKISKQVSTGDLILFPGYLSHYSTTNTGNKQRILLSTNLNETGKFHYTQEFSQYNQDMALVPSTYRQN